MTPRRLLLDIYFNQINFPKEETMSPEKRGTKKYDRQTRKAIQKRIRALYAEGVTDRGELAERLNQEGFLAPSGGPMNRSTVQGQCNNMGGRFKERKGYRRSSSNGEQLELNPKVSADDQEALQDLVLASGMDDARKVKLLRVLREAK
jgi:hypothetical protein